MFLEKCGPPDGAALAAEMKDDDDNDGYVIEWKESGSWQNKNTIFLSVLFVVQICYFTQDIVILQNPLSLIYDDQETVYHWNKESQALVWLTKMLDL